MNAEVGKKMPVESGGSPAMTGLAVLVWTRDRAETIDSGWIESIRAQVAAPIYALAVEDSGLTRVGASLDDMDGALQSVARNHPDCAVLLLRAGIRLPAPLSVLDRVLDTGDLPDLVAFPGNYSDRFNPFSAWPDTNVPEHPERLVYWCGDMRWQWVAAPGDLLGRQCLLLAPGVADQGTAALERAPAALIDSAFAFDPSRALLPAGESDRDGEERSLGQLRLRLRHLALSDAAPAAAASPRLPVTLHIAHGWGGGVWRWIEDFIAGDREAVNLVLVSAGDRSGECCGRSLKLYVGGIGRGLIRDIPLAPEIVSTVQDHRQYRQVLEGLIERFGIGRIIVSSLIGHSLDCLDSSVPTLQVLHDFYPVWPLLDFDPLPFIDQTRGLDRTRALARHGDTLRVRPRDAGFWKRIADSWRRTVKKNEVGLVAPTDQVIRRWEALNPGSGLQIRKIPHAFRPFADRRKVVPPDPEAPLHLVIPGRLTAGKGLGLLEQALPELRRLARITALGCGREAFRLFGQPGIDLIVNYTHAEFSALIRQLRPHAALFLSTVPETWNYALSEVRSLGLVPVATRVGSFPERIRHGNDGLMFEPDAKSLIECVRVLARDPGSLASLSGKKPRNQTPARLVARFNAILPFDPVDGRRILPTDGYALVLGKVAGALARLESRHSSLEQEARRLDAEVEARTRWAEKLDRQFRERSRWTESLRAEVESTREAYSTLEKELEERTAWSKSLDKELASVRSAYAKLQKDFEERTAWALQLEKDKQELEQERLALEADLGNSRRELSEMVSTLEQRDSKIEQLLESRENLQAQYREVINSRSWKLTRPLRFVRRVATRKRMRQLANPLQWIRMARVFLFYWRARGFRGALDALQNPPREEPQTAAFNARQLAVPEDVAPPVELAASGDPIVSVIIPVYNQLAFTAACLQSIAEAQTKVDFEVVVVDDASSDATPAWLEQCSGLLALRNDENTGFIGTCNRGAENARGRYLVFLNNDTRVTDAWLDALVATFEQRPDAGVVGARLVFGDGSLQEAGGIVFRDASGWNFGRGDNPDRPPYGFVSEADYVSGACLAITRDRFRALGGFDTHYAPAYYEDTDLCFKVRQDGLKVYYQPAATIIHFEGVTSGTDESSGAKQYQAVNREKFRQRWDELLKSHPENPGEYSAARAIDFRYRRFEGRALVIDAVTPMPDHDSGSVRMFAMLRLLGELGYRTSFMPENLAWSGHHSADLQQAKIEVLTSPWVRSPEEWMAECGAEVDLVIVSRHYVLANLLKALRKYCPRARVVFDTVDLHFLREQREAEIAGTQAAARAAEQTRREELALVEQADATVVVSEFERTLLAKLVPSANVSVVSNIHSLHPRGKPFEQRRDLVFVGGFQHPPNVDAAEWLIDEILPRVLDELPEVTLHIIGSKMPDALGHREAAGLRVHGFVADLDPFMTGCRISVAPLRYGAGVKGKVNQAMSHGLPVVATSCAAEGMYAEHGHDILVADDAASFAAEICRLYRDQELWQRLAENGRTNVERHFSAAAARTALQAMLAELEARD